MTSNSFTRVLRALLACSSPSYVCGGSRCRSALEDVEPGEGCRRGMLGRAGDWKAWSESDTPSNMC